MRSSTGSGLSGQDSAIWVRPAGTSVWYFSGYPNGSGQVAQELLPSSYDFQARWFGVYQVQSAVAISANSTVTFQGEAVTLSLLSSTGSGLSGQDSAIWVRPAGTSVWYFSGYPNSSGQVAQQLLDGSYDVQFRWLGAYQVSSANAVSGATTIAVNAAALNITARKTSDNSLVSGATTYVITGGGYVLRRLHRRQRPVGRAGARRHGERAVHEVAAHGHELQLGGWSRWNEHDSDACLSVVTIEFGPLSPGLSAKIAPTTVTLRERCGPTGAEISGLFRGIAGPERIESDVSV